MFTQKDVLGEQRKNIYSAKLKYKQKQNTA